VTQLFHLQNNCFILNWSNLVIKILPEDNQAAIFPSNHDVSFNGIGDEKLNSPVFEQAL